jgi:hypothetical protein
MVFYKRPNSRASSPSRNKFSSLLISEENICIVIIASLNRIKWRAIMHNNRLFTVMLALGTILGLLLATGNVTGNAQNQELISSNETKQTYIIPEFISQIGGPLGAITWHANYVYAGIG